MAYTQPCNSAGSSGSAQGGQHLSDWRRAETGGRTFHEVGQRLFQLLGAVVSRYTVH